MSAYAASAGESVSAQNRSGARQKSIVRVDEKSGRLVRAVVATPVVAPALSAANSVDLAAMVDRVAQSEGVEEALVHSVIRAESNYNAGAVSNKGAQGMMQLIPATARRFGVNDAFDPEQNVAGGVKYLKFLLDYYHGDYARAVAAYNAGERAVDKYHGIPPYAETRNYVTQVARNLKTARARKAAAPDPREQLKLANASAPAETYRPIEASVGSDGRIYYRTP